MKKRVPAAGRLACILTVFATAVGFGPLTASAADRVVLAEKFTYCG
jgi:hypothetical protein